MNFRSLSFFFGLFFIGACKAPDPVQIQSSLNEVTFREICKDLTGKTLEDCRKKCKDIYKRSKHRTECENQTVEWIEDIYNTYKILERPNNDLDDIESGLFETYISIDSKGMEALEHIIEDYSTGETREFFFWLMNDWEIAEIFKRRDNDYNTMETLLDTLDSKYNKNRIHEIFLESINGDRLIEHVINAGDSYLEWFMDFINEKNPACAKDTETIDCFKVYCRIGNRLTKLDRKNWSDNERFEKYLNKIIDEKVNSQQGQGANRNSTGWIHEDAPGTRRDQIGDSDDFDRDWVKDLCIGDIID